MKPSRMKIAMTESLDVGEPVEGLEQPGLAEEYDVFVVFAPVVLDRDQGVLFGGG